MKQAIATVIVALGCVGGGFASDAEQLHGSWTGKCLTQAVTFDFEEPNAVEVRLSGGRSLKGTYSLDPKERLLRLKLNWEEAPGHQSNDWEVTLFLEFLRKDLVRIAVPPADGASPRLAWGSILLERWRGVGLMFVVGNSGTSIGDILEASQIYSAQRLPARSELLVAELRLLWKFHDRFDVFCGERPRIEVMQTVDDGPFHDLVIRFPEKN